MDNKITSVNNREDMRLGNFEFRAMNNPVRRWLQGHIEIKAFQHQLKKNNIDLTGKVLMDGGCGSGYDTELLIKAFRPSRMVAFDYMPEQISLAKKRNLNVDFFIGDLTHMEFAPGTFDAVFLFGVLHHIPEWKTALSEILRVLKPGGFLLVEEPREKFSWNNFQAGIVDSGFEILSMIPIVPVYFHSYLCRKIN